MAEPAPLRLRLAALAYDLLPLLGLWFVAGALALAVTAGRFDPGDAAHRALARGLLVAFTAGYFAISWTRGGQTIGMRAWGLQLVDAHGARPAWPRALLRFAVALVSLAALGAGFWWALYDADRRTWHDLAAATRMLRTTR